MKIISKWSLENFIQRNALYNQIKIHWNLVHSNVVAMKSYFEDKENVYLLFELCINDSLESFLKTRNYLSEFEVQYYVYQILKGLEYIHQNNIIHGNLTLKNILLNHSLKIKISNFSEALKFQTLNECVSSELTETTPYYTAPELLIKWLPFTQKVDFWTIGIIIFYLLIGWPPFEGKTVKETYESIYKLNYTFPPELKISKNA